MSLSVRISYEQDSLIELQTSLRSHQLSCSPHSKSTSRKDDVPQSHPPSLFQELTHHHTACGCHVYLFQYIWETSTPQFMWENYEGCFSCAEGGRDLQQLLNSTAKSALRPGPVPQGLLQIGVAESWHESFRTNAVQRCCQGCLVLFPILIQEIAFTLTYLSNQLKIKRMPPHQN